MIVEDDSLATQGLHIVPVCSMLSDCDRCAGHGLLNESSQHDLPRTSGYGQPGQPRRLGLRHVWLHGGVRRPAAVDDGLCGAEEDRPNFLPRPGRAQAGKVVIV